MVVGTIVFGSASLAGGIAQSSSFPGGSQARSGDRCRDDVSGGVEHSHDLLPAGFGSRQSPGGVGIDCRSGLDLRCFSWWSDLWGSRLALDLLREPFQSHWDAALL